MSNIYLMKWLITYIEITFCPFIPFFPFLQVWSLLSPFYSPLFLIFFPQFSPIFPDFSRFFLLLPHLCPFFSSLFSFSPFFFLFSPFSRFSPFSLSIFHHSEGVNLDPNKTRLLSSNRSWRSWKRHAKLFKCYYSILTTENKKNYIRAIDTAVFLIV